MPPDEAAALLIRVAGRPDLDGADTAVRSINRLCGHLPLAIGMLARQLHHHPAWLATRLRPEEGLLLSEGYVERWQGLRAELEERRESRRKQRRFRRDPVIYLNKLEELALQLGLPA